MPAIWYRAVVGKNLHIRDVPNNVHRTLSRRARSEGMSLSAYALSVLEHHCALPSFDEWLGELDALKPVRVDQPGAEAVRRSRDEDDARIGGEGRR